MTTLTIHIPGRAVHMHGQIYEDNAAAVADAIERQLPAIAQRYGRAAAILTKDGVAHIIASARSPACRS